MTLDRKQIQEKLKSIPLFKRFADKPDVLNEVINQLETVKFTKGHEIIKEGATGEEMYILLTGEIEIAKFTMEKERYTVAKLKDSFNIFFGELALVDTDKRSASVTALTDCELLVLTRTKFLELGQKNPEIGWHLTLEIASILSSRLRKANEDAIILFETLVHELSA
jgi:CRP/FNR family cyclic AMP-dependent transcriptional regulator